TQARSKLEYAVYNAAQGIITTPIIKAEAMQDARRVFAHKIVGAEFPNVKPITQVPASDDIIFDENDINVVFTGLLYSDIRNPEYTLELFSRIQNPKLKLYLIGGGCPATVAKYKQIMGSRLIVNEGISMQASFNCMSKADILLNIGNTATNQVPSKIFDYFSIGGPIVNVCKSRSCPTLPYVKHYPLSLNLFEEQNCLQQQAEALEHFCVQKAGQKVPFAMTEKLYAPSTAFYVAKQFHCALTKPHTNRCK
ncbi:MAG: hypothetical protein PHG02_08905, partial [Oscillospiraceae bacterium]|nr:hypothetical protein [Oscillospiraceae bacterium]